MIWGDDMRPQRRRRPVTRWDSPLALVLALLWLVSLLGLAAIADADESEEARRSLPQWTR